MCRSRRPAKIVSAAVCALALFGIFGAAHADCAAGDGVVASPGLCTVPQNLTGPSGIVVGGATLSTGPSTTAYTLSSNNATVTNAGAMTSQGPQVFHATGSGGTLTNSGTMTANPQGPAVLVDANVSLNIVNTGVINGTNFQNVISGNTLIQTGGAINYLALGNAGGPVSTITQASGAINGDLFLGGFQHVTLNVTGGQINGSILGGSAATGNSGSSIFLGGTVNFALGGGSFTTGGGMSVGAVNVQSGTLVLANDIVVNNFTNNATLQVNDTRMLRGNFIQNPAGTLVMRVTPTDSSQLVVFGGRDAIGLGRLGNVKLGGTLALAYAPGTYTARSYTLLAADTSLTGSFANVTGMVPTAGLSQTIAIDPNDVLLVLSGGAGSVPPPASVAVLPNAATAAVLNGQRATGILLDRLGARQGGIADGPAAAIGVSAAPLRVAQNGNIAALGGIAAALPQALAAEGAWFRGLGDFVSVNGNAAMPGFSGSSGGFLAGFDRPVAPDLYLGLAAGYVHSDLTQHPSSSGQVDSGQVAAYGGIWLGPNLFTGTAGYAHDRISTARGVAGIGTATQGHDGHEFTIAGQWSLPVPVAGIAGTALLTPKIGLQFLHLNEDGFRETGIGP